MWPDRLHRAPTSLAAGVFFIALILRIGWVLLRGPEGLNSSDDASAYNDLAVNMVVHHRFVTTMDPPHRFDLPYAQRPPLTPFLLAAVYSVAGLHLLAAQILLALLGALSAGLVFLLGMRLFSERVGALAGVLVAAYPFFIFLSAVPLTENLAILLYVLLAVVLTSAAVGNSPRHAVVTGVLLGVAALNRPQILGFIPFTILIGWMGIGNASARAKWIVVMLVCSAAVIAPWMMRNHSLIGRWVPVSAQGGWVLYEGNNPYTQTALTKLWNGARGWYDDPRLGAGITGPTGAEMDQQASHLAAEFIRNQPAQALSYSMQKVALFFTAYAHPIARISWYPIFALSLLGAYLTRAQWRRLLPVYFLIFQTILTAAVFTSMPRFRAPVEPFLILLAALGLCYCWDRRERLVGLRSSPTPSAPT
jgi:4-amino-4-deoxy-L-arabinose transferase-like glycosyltransferase